MNTTVIKNLGGRVIERDKQTHSVHARFENPRKDLIATLKRKYKRVVELPSAFDDELSLLIYI